jgi:hypothetical protein
LIHAFLIYVHFFRKTTRPQNKAFVSLNRNMADSTTHGRVKKLDSLLKNTDTLELLDFNYRPIVRVCVCVFQHILQSQKVII